MRFLTVVIPVGPKEKSQELLLPELLKFSEWLEIIVVPTEEGTFPAGVQVVKSKIGRAHQMNTGAKSATCAWILFLHADSKLKASDLENLHTLLKELKQGLYYFRLKFADDGPWAMRINEWGVRFRAELLGLPFGDQGFLIPSDLFFSLGGFPENAPYGEDHLFVWKAKQAKVPLRTLPFEIVTSARKYQKGGWGSVTRKHFWLTWRQAAPEFGNLILSRLGLS